MSNLIQPTHINIYAAGGLLDMLSHDLGLGATAQTLPSRRLLQRLHEIHRRQLNATNMHCRLWVGNGALQITKTAASYHVM